MVLLIELLSDKIVIGEFNFWIMGQLIMWVELHLPYLAQIVATLSPLYGADCPAAVVYRVSWPNQQIIRGPLNRLLAQLPEEVERTALILVGPALGEVNFDDSCLYASDYDRRFRPQKALQGKLT